jgi:23S rRNA pseudouridine955/2504/2580 synthase
MLEIIITHENDIDQRIDKFLKKFLPNAPLGGIYKMLRTGKIKVNHKRISQTYILCMQDSLQFWIHDDELNAFQKHEALITKNMTSSKISVTIEERILYEDEDILVINKPTGINVHP